MPSSPNYKRNYKQERLNESPARKKARVQRDEARQEMIKKGVAKVGDGLDVGHLKAVSRGGKNNLTNLAMQPPTSNRSFARTSTGAMASERSKKEVAAKKPGQINLRRASKKK